MGSLDKKWEQYVPSYIKQKMELRWNLLPPFCLTNPELYSSWFLNLIALSSYEKSAFTYLSKCNNTEYGQ
jgi:hypothetical protein